MTSLFRLKIHMKLEKCFENKFCIFSSLKKSFLSRKIIEILMLKNISIDQKLAKYTVEILIFLLEKSIFDQKSPD